nr:DUF4125 family protein [Lachnospiraceae bacterium]
VFIIEEFFESILGRRGLPATTQDWLGIPEDALLAATSGMIFSDPEGIFTEMQVYLAGGYPEDARRRLIAQHMTLFSQYGQYNYARMLARGDRAAATFMVVKATEHAMHLCYLFNREYAPHDKWLLKGMEEFEILPMAEDVMTALLNNPDVHKEEEGVDRIALIEKLAGMFLQEAKNQGLIPGDAVDTYLAGYGRQIAYGDGTGEKMQAAKDSPGPDGSGKEHMDGAEAETAGDGYAKQEPEDAKPAKEDESGDGYSKQELVDAVVRMEFEAFDSVKNEGGRAECQDDWTTFEIMRKSQYLTWTEEMLRQYIVDFQLSMKRGWNPITEKYGRMMESTAPEQYAKIRDSFPVIDADKKEIIEEIVRVQIGWMEDFAARYPRVAREARVIHTSEDTPYVTSYETYLRGEISTYSDEMLMLYGRFIAALAQEGKNLAEMTMLNTVHLYGYKDLAAAEEKMW